MALNCLQNVLYFLLHRIDRSDKGELNDGDTRHFSARPHQDLFQLRATVSTIAKVPGAQGWCLKQLKPIEYN